MKTQLLDGSKTQHINQAASILKAGNLVAIPTETVYGLAANALDAKAVAKIFEAKGRPADHPLIVHIGRIKQIRKLAKDIPAITLSLAKQFWPGPLTILLNKRDEVPSEVTGGLPTIGIRIPDHPATLKLLSQHDLMVAAPSANPYKRLSPTKAEHVLNALEGKIDAILDGGNCHVGLESTIVDLTQYNLTGKVYVRRSGHISHQLLSEVIEQPVQPWQPHNVSVPGNVSAHYQPTSKLLIKGPEQITSIMSAKSDSATGIICYSPCLHRNLVQAKHQHIIKLPEDKQGFARSLYSALFQMDEYNLSEIWLERPPINESWLDVNDRLSRAVSKH